MAATSRDDDSPDDDGYKRFTEDIRNVSYGSNSTSKLLSYQKTKNYENAFRINRNTAVVLMYQCDKGEIYVLAVAIIIIVYS